MKVAEAKDMVVDLILRDIASFELPLTLDPVSPDGDPGKFMLQGRTARAMHHYDGWYVQINRDWFSGSMDPPSIQKGKFYWYVFAIPGLSRYSRPHYLICDYLQVRDWVMEFTAPLGRDHHHHQDWRASIIVDRRLSAESEAYFRWGDEPPGQWLFPTRIVRLDNADVVANSGNLINAGLRIGTTSASGESEAHRRLKLYVAKHPYLLSLSPTAIAEVEHQFITGDRVDVLFQNHGPLRTVAEVELQGTENIIVGIHQAIKYRSLAAAEANLHLFSRDDPGAHVVAFESGGERAEELANAYNVRLHTIDKSMVLMPD